MKGSVRTLIRLAPAALLAGVVASTIVIGCATNQPSPMMQAAPAAPPPLQLCAVTTAAPARIASEAGYSEYFVTVSGRTGPILGLKQGDFLASHGGKPVALQFFKENQSDVPASIVIVIDSSASMKTKTRVNERTRLEMTRDSIAAAMNGLNACDELAVIDFGGPPSEGFGERFLESLQSPITPPTFTHVQLVQPFTTDHSLAMARLDGIVPWGQTPLYNSIHSALLVLGHAHYPHRAVILVTDGMDTASTVKPDDVIEEAGRKGAAIYALGLGDPNASGLIGPFFKTSGAGVDGEALGGLAAGTGGLYFVISPTADDAGSQLTAALNQISAVLGQGYTIGLIVPDGAAPEIRIASHPEATAHAFRIPPKPAVAPVPRVKSAKPA